MYIHIYIYTHAYLCMYACMYECMCVCMYVYIYIYIYIYIYTCMCRYIHPGDHAPANPVNIIINQEENNTHVEQRRR